MCECPSFLALRRRLLSASSPLASSSPKAGIQMLARRNTLQKRSPLFAFWIPGFAENDANLLIIQTYRTHTS